MTQVEQINRDGTSKKGLERWSAKIEPLREFSLEAYLRALLTAREGRYRVIVFIVTSGPFPLSDVEVTSEDARGWLSRGFNHLPESIAALPFTEESKCSVLVFEFLGVGAGDKPTLVLPSSLTAIDHLKR